MRKHGCAVPPSKVKDLADLFKWVDVDSSPPEFVHRLMEDIFANDDYCRRVFREILAGEQERKKYREVEKEIEKELKEIKIWSGSDPIKESQNLIKSRPRQGTGSANAPYTYECVGEEKKIGSIGRISVSCKIVERDTGRVVSDVRADLSSEGVTPEAVKNFLEEHVRDLTEILNKAKRTGNSRLEKQAAKTVEDALRTLSWLIKIGDSDKYKTVLRRYALARTEAVKNLLRKSIERNDPSLLRAARRLLRYLDWTVRDAADYKVRGEEHAFNFLKNIFENYGVRADPDKLSDPVKAAKVAGAVAERAGKLTTAYKVTKGRDLYAALWTARSAALEKPDAVDKDLEAYLTRVAKEKIMSALKRMKARLRDTAYRKGKRIDMRKTIKEAMRMGVPLNIYYRKKRRKKPGYTLIVDVSGSMVDYLPVAEAFYQVGREATSRPWNIFYFTDRLYGNKEAISLRFTDFGGILQAAKAGKLDKRNPVILFTDLRRGSGEEPYYVVKALADEGYRVYVINPEHREELLEDPGDSDSLYVEDIVPVYYLGDDIEDGLARALVEIARSEEQRSR